MMRQLTIAFVLAFLFGQAQVRNTDTTVFEYQTQGKLPVANSLKLKDQPAYVDTVRMVPEMKYSIVSRPASPPVHLVPMKQAKMEGEPLKKLYHGFVKAGIGTYTTPLLEVRLDQLRSKTASYGVHLKHLSSASRLKGAGYAGYSDDLIGGHLKYFLRRHTLSSRLGYARNGFHYYGYDSGTHTLSDNEYIRQVLHRLNMGVELKSHFSDSSRLNHSVSMNILGLRDINEVKETNLLMRADLGKVYKGHFFGGRLVFDHLLNKQDFIDTASSTIFKFEPFVQYSGHKFKARLGVSVTASIAGRSKFRMYPNMEVHYDVADHIFIPYAGLGGGMTRRSFSDLADGNPFTDPDVSFSLRNEDVRIELYGGMRGALSRSVSYNLRTSYKRIWDYAFYVTDTVLGTPDIFEIMQNRFKMVYDTVTRISAGGELHFRRDAKFSLLLRGSYNLYTPETERYAWHSPAIELDAFFRYDLRGKIIADLNVFYRSKQLAPVQKSTAEPDGVAELKGYADVNLLLEYRYNKRLGFFLNTCNLTSARYYRWLNYPHQRIQVMGGLSFSF
ncbi:MAG: hypothetical protein IT233_13150 [Bacteroidia bacterium]|nr:hypothetical protein [Bacteroidia bacterium]